MGVGDEVRDARLAAGLSQRALAQRAGVPLSTVGRIERGITMPRFDTLTAIAEALGRELHISFRPRLPSWLESLRPQLQEVCLSFGARNLAVFGSVADGTDDAHSDLDLLVDLPPGADLLTLVRLERCLAELVGRDVDVIPRDTLTEDFPVERSIVLTA